MISQNLGDAAVIYQADPAAPPLELDLYHSGVRCGFPSPADEYATTRMDLNAYVVQHPGSTFYVKAVGGSMLPAIHPGDLLVVDRALQPTPGKVVIAVVAGEFTAKRLRLVCGVPCLAADDPGHATVPVGDGSDVAIWGVVTHVIHQP